MRVRIYFDLSEDEGSVTVCGITAKIGEYEMQKWITSPPPKTKRYFFDGDVPDPGAISPAKYVALGSEPAAESNGT